MRPNRYCHTSVPGLGDREATGGRSWPGKLSILEGDLQHQGRATSHDAQGIDKGPGLAATPAALKGTRHYTISRFGSTPPPRHSPGLLPSSIMRSHIQSLGRNQAITATPSGEICFPGWGKSRGRWCCLGKADRARQQGARATTSSPAAPSHPNTTGARMTHSSHGRTTSPRKYLFPPQDPFCPLRPCSSH